MIFAVAAFLVAGLCVDLLCRMLRRRHTFRDKHVLVTGGSAGIGKALALRFDRAGARHIVVADRDAAGAKAVADAVGGTSMETDVSDEAAIARVIETTETTIGPIDLFCSNAGIAATDSLDSPNDEWQLIWDVNVMAHVYAARHLVPRMVARGGGYLLNTASAAGLLNQVGAAPYGVTKHAAVGLAEWLAMTHGDEGIKVSVLCPQGVRTEMTRGHEDHVAAADGMLEPGDVAEFCIQAIRDEVFLILPHPGVLQYMQNKTTDYERWIGGMRKLNRIYGDL